MAKRWGPGPVFVFESIVSARRWQVYAGRAVFVLVLLASMMIVWYWNREDLDGTDSPAALIAEMAKVGERFFYALTGAEISLILLAAPAAAAASFGTDRARSTLWHVFVTDLSDTEIVLGTLGARLAPVWGTILCAVPVTALAALLGGIDFAALAGAFVVTLALALLGCVLALTVSVWVTKAHEVLMAVYLILGFWLLALPNWQGLARAYSATISAPPSWFAKTNPYVLAFAPYYQPGYARPEDYAAFAGGVLVLSTVLMVLSIARLRRVVIVQSGQAERRARRLLPSLTKAFPSWPSPTPDGNPVLWREWHRNLPSRLARRLWTGLLMIAWSLAAVGTYDTIIYGVADGSGALQIGFGLTLFFGLLMLCATAPTVLAEDRARGCLDVVLASPLCTRSIVVGKWWGVYRRVLAMLPFFAYVALFLTSATPDVIPAPVVTGWPSRPPLTLWDRLLMAALTPADFLVSGALVVSGGLLLATWIRRINRAVVLCVIGYFLIGVGWPILVQFSYWPVMSWLAGGIMAAGWWNETRWVIDCLSALSPLQGPIQILNSFEWYYVSSAWRGIGLVAVVAIKALTAWLLLDLSVRTFDRFVGRVPEVGVRV
jgi:hypothetical protein